MRSLDCRYRSFESISGYGCSTLGVVVFSVFIGLCEGLILPCLSLCVFVFV